MQFLADNPLLLLFAVIGLGVPFGRVGYRGVTLGVAGVLFAGLVAGAADDRLRLPEVVQMLGLVLFVYAVGLSAGPSFVASFRRDGLRNAVLAASSVAAAALVIAVGAPLLGISEPSRAGLFAGALTNTPSLAAALDALRHSPSLAGDAAARDAQLALPVVAYSLAYPIGVLAAIVGVVLVERIATRPTPTAAGEPNRSAGESVGGANELLDAGSGGLVIGTVRLTKLEAPTQVGTLIDRTGSPVQPGRLQRADGEVELATDDVLASPGDLLSVVGAVSDVERAMAVLGEPSAEAIALNRQTLDTRRVFVSNPRVAGRRLRDLQLPERLGATLTAIRRGDADWVPTGETILQLGDRVRVLTRRQNLKSVSQLLGDSYRAVSEADILTLSFGIVLGIAVGLIPFPMPGGMTLRLGLAGGPLVAAMALGARGRTWRLVWGLPYGVTLTLRQLGLILFFAGVGTRSGAAVADALQRPETLRVFGLAAATAGASVLVAHVLGRRVFRIPAATLEGMVSGIQTQPAALSVALERRGTETPNEGYAAVFPVATLAKLIVAQILASA